MILQMIEIRLCINFRFWPHGMENDLKNPLFHPYHPAKAHEGKGVG